MSATISTWLGDARGVVLVAYLTVAAIGVKPETRRHLSLRIGRVLAIPGAFLLPRRPIFRRLSVAPARAVARGRGGRAHGTTVPD